MDLIEKLGGYEEAKKIKVAFDATHYCISRKSQMKMFSVGAISDATIAASSACGFKETKLEDNDLVTQEQINRALLEYRRQHKIYEVGDKVVLISMSDNEVFEYTEYSKGLDLHFFESEHNYGHAKLSNIRHATDAEIQAGKRLDD